MIDRALSLQNGPTLPDAGDDVALDANSRAPADRYSAAVRITMEDVDERSMFEMWFEDERCQARTKGYGSVGRRARGSGDRPAHQDAIAAPQDRTVVQY